MVEGATRKVRGEGVILNLLMMMVYYLGGRVQGATYYNVGSPTTTWTFPPASASTDGWYTDVWAKSHDFQIGDTLGGLFIISKLTLLVMELLYAL